MSKLEDELTRRERQIMDVVHRLGSATAAEVVEEIPDHPGYSSVRKLMSILEEKGHLRHRRDGKQYVYLPTEPRNVAAEKALKTVLSTFFGGSLEKAMTTFLNSEEAKVSDDELQRLAQMIEEAQREQSS